MSTNHESRITNYELRITNHDGYRILLWIAIIGYTILFAGLAFDQHLGMRTHKADLGQIDQAVWNSSRGRFVESTDTGFIASRLTDHVEPILALVSPVLWLWDDVRALLLLQVLFVAIGAWPLYELALLQLDKVLSPRERTQIWQIEPLRQLTRPMALALAIAYLLAPQLQSALLSEFHAAPLAVPLILWAFWAIETGRLWHFVIATLLVALVKEEMALLSAGLGLWALWSGKWQVTTTKKVTPPLLSTNHLVTLSPCHLVILSVILASLAWFYLTTFVIVPANAVQIYDTAESVYFGRYGTLGDSPLDILKSFFTQPTLVWQIATEPARVQYVWGLLAPFGLLSLLAPELILLSLPLLLANLLSAYPAQYYGEFHYSAPLVPYFAVSAAYGLGRLWRWIGRNTGNVSASYQHLPAASIGMMTLASLFTNARTALRPLLALACTLWLLGWAAVNYHAAGRGPLAARYDPTPITAHHRLLPRFVEQIPPDAAVSATAAVHPHVSHRRYVYQFPIGLPELGEAGQADWALLDVTTNTDMAPGDLKSAVDRLLVGEWGVVDGVDGFLLLRRGGRVKMIPDAFYDFARSEQIGEGAAAQETSLLFTNAQTEDWPRWRQTRVNACWQVGPTFHAAPVTPQLEIITPAGDLLYSFSVATPPALVWYPLAQWQVGEVVCLKTLPLYLPTLWGLRVAPVGQHSTQGDLSPYSQTLLQSPDEATTLVQLFRRMKNGQLQSLSAASAEGLQEKERGATITAQGKFLLRDTPIPVTLSAPIAIPLGAKLNLHLVWGGGSFGDWPANHSLFVHLRQGETTIAQADGPPRFFYTEKLTVGSESAGIRIHEWRQLTLPENVAPGEQLIVAMGLYNPATGERLILQQATDQGTDNELLAGPIKVESPPIPDQACALVPASCASTTYTIK